MLQETLKFETKATSNTVEIAQAGALCIRGSKTSPLEVLLVASLRNGRWGLPKGHIEANESSKETAAREAFEEAGILGSAETEPFGTFCYFKDTDNPRYRVTVHLLKLRSMASAFPEKTTRKAKWFPLDEAAREASQPGLRELLANVARRVKLSTRIGRRYDPSRSSRIIAAISAFGPNPPPRGSAKMSADGILLACKLCPGCGRTACVTGRAIAQGATVEQQPLRRNTDLRSTAGLPAAANQRRSIRPYLSQPITLSAGSPPLGRDREVIGCAFFA